MSILLDRMTRVLVHGASSTVGAYQVGRMRNYGTQVVGIVSRAAPAGFDLPTYGTVSEAQRACHADLLVSYANGRYLLSTAEDAFSAGVDTVVAVAEEVRFRDIVAARQLARQSGGMLVGPNTNGILTPGEAVVGMFAPEFGLPGRVGVLSRSGTLAYGSLLELQRAEIGQSTVVGIGGGLGRGLSAADALLLFEDDPDTDLVLVLGETGSDEEESVAEVVGAGLVTKPVVALVVGAVGQPNQLMGHAGAVVYGTGRTFAHKVARLSAAGVVVVPTLGELADAIGSLLSLVAASGKDG